MRKSFLAILICSAFLIACKGNNDHGHQHDSEGNHIEGSHQHEDGTIHENHDTVPANQETFDVTTDTTKHNH